MKKIPLLLAFFVAACQPNNPQNAEHNTENTADADRTMGSTVPLGLRCKDLGMDKNEVPHNAILLIQNGVATPIDSVLGCETIEKADYASKQIPADAVAACGGWYAGAGDYFYLVLKNGKPVVYKGWQDEQQEDEGFHWEAMK
jgi:hypothetical protein